MPPQQSRPPRPPRPSRSRLGGGPRLFEPIPAMPQLLLPPRLPAPLEPCPPLDPSSMPCPPPPPPPLFRPPHPFPTPLAPSPPQDATSTPIPPPPPIPIPPLAAKNQERRTWPQMKKKMSPVNHKIGSVERACGMAMMGLHIVICIVMILSFAESPPEDRFLICLYLCFAAIVLITCVDIFYDDPSPQQKAAQVQLPPPPPEMDMC